MMASRFSKTIQMGGCLNFSSWTATLFLILLAAASNHRNNQQQNNRSDDRCYQRAKRAYGNPSHQPHEPATEKTADDADNQVDDEARSATPDNKVRKPAGDKSNK